MRYLLWKKLFQTVPVLSEFLLRKSRVLPFCLLVIFLFLRFLQYFFVFWFTFTQILAEQRILQRNTLNSGLCHKLLGSLNNGEGDGNENAKNNNFARASRFLVHFSAVVARLMPKFTFCRGREHKTTTFVFFFWTLIHSFRFQLQKNLPTFDELDEVE